MARGKLPEEEKCVKVSISFSPDQLKELTAYCQKNDRSYAWCIRKALAEWLPKQKDD